MGGETRTQLNVNRLLSDIQYIRNLNGAAIFDYVPSQSIQLHTNEIHQLLRLIEKDGNLEILGVHKESNDLSNMVKDLNPSLSNDIMTTIYRLDTSKTSFPQQTAADSGDVISIGFVLKNQQLHLLANNSSVVIANFHDDSEPAKILGAIFREPGVRVRSVDILPMKKNLKNILERNNLSYLIDCGIIEVDKDTVRLISGDKLLTTNEAKKLVSKFIEKYRSDAQRLLQL